MALLGIFKIRLLPKFENKYVFIFLNNKFNKVYQYINNLYNLLIDIVNNYITIGPILG